MDDQINNNNWWFCAYKALNVCRRDDVNDEAVSREMQDTTVIDIVPSTSSHDIDTYIMNDEHCAANLVVSVIPCCASTYFIIPNICSYKS